MGENVPLLGCLVNWAYYAMIKQCVVYAGLCVVYCSAFLIMSARQNADYEDFQHNKVKYALSWDRLYYCIQKEFMSKIH